MAPKKGARHTPPIKTPPPPSNTAPPPTPPTNRVLKFAGAVLTLLAALAGAVTLLPRVGLHAPETATADPLSTVFSITNDSLLNMRNVTVSCWLDRADFKNRRGVGLQTENNVLEFGEASTDLIRPGGEFTTQCHRVGEIFEGELTSDAIMTLAVTYRPAFRFMWLRHEDFTVAVTRRKDGTWLIERRGQS